MYNTLKKLVINYADNFSNKAASELVNSLNSNEKILFTQMSANVGSVKLSQSLYGSDPSTSSFQSLQSRMFDKISAAYLHIDSGCKIQRKKAALMRSVALCRILELYGLRSIMVTIAKKTIQKCHKLDLWFELTDLYRMLSKHYAIYEVDVTQAEKYREMALYSVNIHSIENNVEWAFSKAVNISRTTKNVDQIKELADNIESSLGHNTDRIVFYYYALRCVQYFCAEDIGNAITSSKTGLKHFEKTDYDHELATNYFKLQLILAYLASNQFDKVKSNIFKLLESTPQKTHHYFTAKELLFRVHISQGELEECAEILPYLKNRARKYGDNDTKDRVLIYEMYLDLMQGNQINFKRLRYNLNRVRSEKEYIHIPFKIAEICYLYLNDTDALLDKIESLRSYSWRELKDSKYSRTREFIKIVECVLSNKDYDTSALSSPIQISNHSIEIVNYEILIDLITSGKKISRLL